MNVLVWIVVGLCAGHVAMIVSPGLEPGGFLATLLVGVVGAFIGGWAYGALGGAAATLPAMASAAVGAAVCLALWRSMAGTRTI